MFKLRYYCAEQGTKEIRELLAQIKAKHAIQHEILDLSRNGVYDAERERQIYERDFKPRARTLKRRTGKPITKLRSARARHYFVSLPGTIAVVDKEIEWWTLGDEEIKTFLEEVLSRGLDFLEGCCA